MTTAELRSAMEQQARAVGLRFEADLSNTILDAVRDEPGAMPLLQHLLNELWQHRHGRWLLGSEYRAIGGIQQAIARTADRVYGDLAPAERDQVRDIFLRLTRLDEDMVQGEERRDSRRRVAMEELVAPGHSYDDTKALVKRLADSRLVVASVNDVTGLEEVEVAHEALIRYWPLLRSWLDGDRELLRVREGVRRAAWEWQTSQQDESYLVHRGKRLRSAEALLAHPRVTLNQQEAAYVRACLSAETAALTGQQAEKRRRNRLPEAEIRILRPASRGERHPIALTVQEGQGNGTLRLDLPRLLRSPDPRSYGQVLGQALFADAEIEGLFRRALGRATERGLALRVRLRLDPPELHALHWERTNIPGPDGALPLASSALTPFSRATSRAWRRREAVRSKRGAVHPHPGGHRVAERPGALRPGTDRRRRANDRARCPGEIVRNDPRRAGHRHGCCAHSRKAGAGAGSRLPPDPLSLPYGAHGRQGTRSPVAGRGKRRSCAGGGRRTSGDAESTGAAPSPFWFLGAPKENRSGVQGNGALSFAHALVARGGAQAAVAMRYFLAQPAAGQTIGRFYAGLLAHGAADVALNEARAGIPDEWDRAAPVLLSRLPECQILEVTP